MKKSIDEKIKMISYDDLFSGVDEAGGTEVAIDRICSFPKHPFRVSMDGQMEELIESIRVNGILTPVILRPGNRKNYEMISGHRRMYAARYLGLTSLPAVIREVGDDEATILMVDSNIQREKLLPSEKAFAYKMKMDALKRQGKRPEGTSAQTGWKWETAQVIGRETGESKNQVRRYVRLTELIPDLLDMVDDGKIPFTVGVEISYIEKELQDWMVDPIKVHGVRMDSILKIRALLKEGELTREELLSILAGDTEKNSRSVRISLSSEQIVRFFPGDFSTEEIKKIIVSLLEGWSDKGGCNNESM